MDLRPASDEPTGPDEHIAGERRTDRRYDIRLELHWKVIRRRRILAHGEGRTLDVSSGGVLFEADWPLSPGMTVEMSISWPVLLHDVAPLQLEVCGRVVRSEAGRCALRISRHEFRTAGTGALRRAGGKSTLRAAPALFGSREAPTLRTLQ